jgi:hypothetical protein
MRKFLRFEVFRRRRYFSDYLISLSPPDLLVGRGKGAILLGSSDRVRISGEGRTSGRLVLERSR